jgi:hypothetical protein
VPDRYNNFHAHAGQAGEKEKNGGLLVVVEKTLGERVLFVAEVVRRVSAGRRVTSGQTSR